MYINLALCADKIVCLLAPSASDMQIFLDVCYEYGINTPIIFNSIKSGYTIFKPIPYK